MIQKSRKDGETTGIWSRDSRLMDNNRLCIHRTIGETNNTQNQLVCNPENVDLRAGEKLIARILIL